MASAISYTNKDKYYSRLTYDAIFWFMLNLIFINIVSGLIIDSFGALRDAKEETDDIMYNVCFVC